MSFPPAALSLAGNTVGTFVPAVRHRLKQMSTELRNYFGTSFCLRDASSGELMLASDDQILGDDPLLASLCPGIHREGVATIVAEETGCAMLAIPMRDGVTPYIATAPFRLAISGKATPDFGKLSQVLGCSPKESKRWYQAQAEWTIPALERMAAIVVSKITSDSEIERLTEEIDKVSDSLSSTYEEISLLYGLTQNLRISSSDSQLGDLALNWLLEVIPSRGLSILYQQPGRRTGQNDSAGAQYESQLLSVGECPVDAQTLSHLVKKLNLNEKRSAFVANQRVTERPDWPCPEIRQIIAVPLVEGDNIFGWLFAINHNEDKGFGTVEASLLSSVGTILGIHSGNIELYRRQSEFVTSVVRALTSAIDAKDPYTCGHSDRVARLAVRLAQEMGLDKETLNLMYMAGLLHDVGKIGIDDSVLRKPGRLTDEEYEHIKLHPELGCNILSGLKQLEAVLPVVLHHHEQWDGKGYPHKLAGETIPKLARITAVADAYDAMSSDRPYRKGMPEDRVNQIFREGSGTQWDPEVIEAFFAARDDIRKIMSEERAGVGFDVSNWIKSLQDD
ncbi:HD-GYP domain-containing protein [Bremerella sp. P1]|uniref:HD-GYP domain-containing protein n=1 Tax=Bremerella sp. P1 TaxID=3026424 RepID=UPI002368187A|nr:HD-GYP domain-containing protein [Bremerella sp. P1]WDI40384.1 HD-GYP domain-containing protein [Bremerella sp. P1]